MRRKVMPVAIALWALQALACSKETDDIDGRAVGGSPDNGGAAGASAGAAGSPSGEVDGAALSNDATSGGQTPTASDATSAEPVSSDASAMGVGVADAPAERGVYHSSTRQTPKVIGSTAAAVGYLEYLPPGYGDGTKRPLLVFVNGITENGNGNTELDKLKRRGPPKLIAEDSWPDDRPFIVLSQQHTADQECASAKEVYEFITYALANYQVDLQHVYLTAVSCGAIASWNYVGAYGATQIAAAVLVAGDGGPAWATKMCDLATVPIWGFHAEGDETIPPTGTSAPIDHLIACNSGKEYKKTIYPGMTHDSWTKTYDLSAGHDIYSWMLSKSR